MQHSDTRNGVKKIKILGYLFDLYKISQSVFMPYGTIDAEISYSEWGGIKTLDLDQISPSLESCETIGDDSFGGEWQGKCLKVSMWTPKSSPQG